MSILSIISAIWYFDQLIYTFAGQIGVTVLFLGCLFLVKFGFRLKELILSVGVVFLLFVHQYYGSLCGKKEIDILAYFLMLFTLYVSMRVSLVDFISNILNSPKIISLVLFISIIDYEYLYYPSLFGQFFGESMFGPYHEPSHAILYLFPILLLGVKSPLLIRFWKHKIKAIKLDLFLYIYIVVNFSSLALLAFIINLSSFFYRRLYLVLAVLISAGALFFLVDWYYKELFREFEEITFLLSFPTMGITYFLAAVDGGSITILVLLSGWQRGFDLISLYSVWGEGFNSMGCSGYKDIYQTAMADILGGVPSVQDGSFLFSKILNELGVFGLFIFIVFLYRLFQALFFEVSIDKKTRIMICIFMCCLFLIRNPGGYFVLPSILVFSFLFSGLGSHEKNK